MNRFGLELDQNQRNDETKTEAHTADTLAVSFVTPSHVFSLAAWHY